MYEESIVLLHYAAFQKNIELDGYFRMKWEIEEDYPMTFGDEYFADENRSELYVYLAANISEEIYEGLKFAYNLTPSAKVHERTITSGN